MEKKRSPQSQKKFRKIKWFIIVLRKLQLKSTTDKINGWKDELHQRYNKHATDQQPQILMIETTKEAVAK